jgi:hypothetical protein
MSDEYDDEDDDEFRLKKENRIEAQEKIGALLSELRSVMGPGQINGEPYPPDGDYFPTDWVIVTGWTDMNSGQTFTMSLGNAEYAGPMQKGLLFTALHDM